MNNKTLIKTTNVIYIGISILGLTSVSLLSIYDPQATMDLVNVKLSNNDAISSIRGIYGGVGLSIIISLLYLCFTQKARVAISFLTLFWSSYAISRLITIYVNGPLGAFGNQWIVIESAFCLSGLTLVLWNRSGNYEKNKFSGVAAN